MINRVFDVKVTRLDPFLTQIPTCQKRVSKINKNNVRVSDVISLFHLAFDLDEVPETVQHVHDLLGLVLPFVADIVCRTET